MLLFFITNNAYSTKKSSKCTQEYQSMIIKYFTEGDYSQFLQVKDSQINDLYDISLTFNYNDIITDKICENVSNINSEKIFDLLLKR